MRYVTYTSYASHEALFKHLSAKHGLSTEKVRTIYEDERRRRTDWSNEGNFQFAKSVLVRLKAA